MDELEEPHEECVEWSVEVKEVLWVCVVVSVCGVWCEPLHLVPFHRLKELTSGWITYYDAYRLQILN